MPQEYVLGHDFLTDRVLVFPYSLLSFADYLLTKLRFSGFSDKYDSTVVKTDLGLFKMSPCKPVMTS